MAGIGCCLLLAALCSGAVSAAPIPSRPGIFATAINAVHPAKAKSAQKQRRAGNAKKKRKANSVAATELPVPQLPVNVSMKAVLAPGAPALSEGLSWRVLSAAQPAAERKLIWSGSGAEPKIHLEPGRYLVEAVYGLAAGRQEIRVEEGKRLHTTVSLNAGTVRAKGAAVPGGPALDDMFFILRKDGVNGAAGPKAQDAAAPTPADVGRSALAEALFHVPAGSYRLIARHGLATAEVPLTVEAGRATDTEAVMNTGILTLSARAERDGPALSGVQFFVFDGNGNDGRLIVRSNRDEPEFSLPAGKYRIAAELGLAREERLLELSAGGSHSETLVLDAGALKLSSMRAVDGQPLDRNLLYKVFRLSGGEGTPNQALATLTAASPTLFLKHGKYRVESHLGWQNARQVRDVDVSAGDVTEVAFEQHACAVKLKLVAKPGGDPIAKVKWTLKYADGGTVLISQDAIPELVLQAGAYQAMAQHEAKTFSRTFDAAANDEQTIELIAE